MKTRFLSIPLAALLFLTACTAETGKVSVEDAWIKATESDMTGAYGIIENSTKEDLEVVSAEISGVPVVELHETKPDAAGNMVMSAVTSFIIPAQGKLILEPGGDHLMLMALTDHLLPGEQYEVTLKLKAGDDVTFTAVVKEFAGGNEEYDHGDGHDHSHGHSDDSHGDHDHGGQAHSDDADEHAAH